MPKPRPIAVSDDQLAQIMRQLAPLQPGERNAAATAAETGEAAHHATPDATAALEAEIHGLRQIGELLRRELDDIREDRDRWRGQAERLALAPPHATDATGATPAARPWWRRLAG